MVIVTDKKAAKPVTTVRDSVSTFKRDTTGYFKPTLFVAQF